jgi:hypothetical protein
VPLIQYYEILHNKMKNRGKKLKENVPETPLVTGVCMPVHTVFNPQRDIITCEEWFSRADPCTGKILNSICSVLSISSFSEFSSVSIVQRNPTDDEILEFVKGLGKCYLFNGGYANTVFPFFSQNESVQPIIFVDPSYSTLPDPIKTIVLSYAFFFIDWHIKMRNYSKTHSFSQNDEMTLQYCGMFFSEYESFKLYLQAFALTGRDLDMTEIKEGCIDYKGSEPGIYLGMAVEYFAKILAISDFNALSGSELKEDQSINNFFKEKIGPSWDRLKILFSKTRTFAQVLDDYRELASLLTNQNLSSESLHKIDELRIKSAQAFSSGKCEMAVNLCEQYVSELRKIGADRRQLSFALSNLHSYYCGTKKYGEAESIMTALYECAEPARDFVALAYAHMNLLQNPTLFMDEKRSIEQIKLSLASLDRFTEEEFQRQKQDIHQILNVLAQYLVIFSGAPETKPLGDKLIALYKKAGC